MATDQRMNHCKRCGKATIHISHSTSHLLHLFLSVMTFGVWMLVWLLMAMGHGAESRCTECGKNRRALIPTLALTALIMAVVLPVWHVLNEDKPNEGAETQNASLPRPAPNSDDGVLRWAPRAAPDPDGVLRGEFR